MATPAFHRHPLLTLASLALLAGLISAPAWAGDDDDDTPHKSPTEQMMETLTKGMQDMNDGSRNRNACYTSCNQDSNRCQSSCARQSATRGLLDQCINLCGQQRSSCLSGC